MNILYVTPCLPYPPNKGEKIRAFHLIRHLAREHTVHVACLAGDDDDRDAVAALAAHGASVDAVHRPRMLGRVQGALALLTGTPFSVAAASSRRLRRRIARTIRARRFDVILVFSSAMGGYVSRVRSVPRVLDYVDVDSELWRLYVAHHRFPYSSIYRREARRLARHEQALARAFDHAVFVSAAEARLFGDRAGDCHVSVIGNGVDLDFFALGEPARSPAGPPTVVFTGTMDYFPNVDAVGHFCHRILPLVRASVPDVELHIVGRNPTAQVAELGRQPHVTVTGAVPDVRPYLARARVCIAPFRVARGVQNKILEAMAVGVPVVGTSIAFEGLDATEEDGVRIVDDPAGFAGAVVALLGDPDARRSSALRARRYVERAHRWADHGARLASLLREVAERP